MPEHIACDSCRRVVPDDLDTVGHLCLTAPPGLDRHWPRATDGRCMATLCASCVARLQIYLFGPTARRQPLSVDPDDPGPRLACVDDQQGAAPAARGG